MNELIRVIKLIGSLTIGHVTCLQQLHPIKHLTPFYCIMRYVPKATHAVSRIQQVCPALYVGYYNRKNLRFQARAYSPHYVRAVSRASVKTSVLLIYNTLRADHSQRYTARALYTVRPLYNAVLGGTGFLSQKPRYREVRVILAERLKTRFWDFCKFDWRLKYSSV